MVIFSGYVNVYQRVPSCTPTSSRFRSGHPSSGLNIILNMAWYGYYRTLPRRQLKHTHARRYGMFRLRYVQLFSHRLAINIRDKPSHKPTISGCFFFDSKGPQEDSPGLVHHWSTPTCPTYLLLSITHYRTKYNHI